MSSSFNERHYRFIWTSVVPLMTALPLLKRMAEVYGDQPASRQVFEKVRVHFYFIYEEAEVSVPPTANGFQSAG